MRGMTLLGRRADVGTLKCESQPGGQGCLRLVAGAGETGAGGVRGCEREWREQARTGSDCECVSVPSDRGLRDERGLAVLLTRKTHLGHSYQGVWFMMMPVS